MLKNDRQPHHCPKDKRRPGQGAKEQPQRQLVANGQNMRIQPIHGASRRDAVVWR